MYNVRCMVLVRTQINIEEEQYRLLILEAQRQKRSLSDIVRETIDKKFIKPQKKNNAGALLRIAQHAVDFKKINPNVPDDLAENHDEYLYGRKSKWANLWKRPKKYTKRKT